MAEQRDSRAFCHQFHNVAHDARDLEVFWRVDARDAHLLQRQRISRRDDAADHETDAPSEGARMMIPFGPFLALGALEFLFFGERLIDAYFGLFEG